MQNQTCDSSRYIMEYPICNVLDGGVCICENKLIGRHKILYHFYVKPNTLQSFPLNVIFHFFNFFSARPTFTWKTCQHFGD